MSAPILQSYCWGDTSSVATRATKHLTLSCSKESRQRNAMPSYVPETTETVQWKTGKRCFRRCYAFWEIFGRRARISDFTQLENKAIRHMPCEACPFPRLVDYKREKNLDSFPVSTHQCVGIGGRITKKRFFQICILLGSWYSPSCLGLEHG